jgi:hypothetical protein
VSEEPPMPSEPQIPATFDAAAAQSAASQSTEHTTEPQTAAPPPQQQQSTHTLRAVPDGLPPPSVQPPVQPSAAESGPTIPTTPTAKKPNRTAFIGGVGLAYVVLAAGAAAAVVALASPAPVDTAALGSPPRAATASATRTGGASASTRPNSVASGPVSTITGTVSGGIHHGDLRYFLLPPSGGPSSVQGDPDGTAEGETAVIGEYGTDGDSSEITQVLKKLDFKSGATRTYQDSSLGADVTIELVQFGSPTDAKKWLGAFQGSLPAGSTALTIPGESGSTGWSDADAVDGSYSLTGLFTEGDTYYDVTVVGPQEIDQSSLTNLMTSQYSRLANG